MIIRAVEVRDRGVFVPCLVILMVPRCNRQRYLLSRVGFAPEDVLLVRLDTQEAHTDPTWWGADRTMLGAHRWLQGHFCEVSDGSVVDVQHILGETAAPVVSERVVQLRRES